MSRTNARITVMQVLSHYDFHEGELLEYSQSEQAEGTTASLARIDLQDRREEKNNIHLQEQAGLQEQPAQEKKDALQEQAGANISKASLKKILRAAFAISFEETAEQTDEVALKKIFSSRDLAFASDLLEAILRNQIAIDQKITKASKKWKLSKMGLVDRNILRLAVGEMLYIKEKKKDSIVINEAVELAKLYGSNDECYKFVNGILSELRKELR